MVKLSIRGRVLLLLLASVLITLMAVGGLAFYALNTTKITMLAQSEAVGQFLAESMGRKAASDAKNDLQEMTRVKAQHLSRELMMVKKDVAYMADSLQLILTSPAQYRPRKLPDTQQEPDIFIGNGVYSLQSGATVPRDRWEFASTNCLGGKFC